MRTCMIAFMSVIFAANAGSAGLFPTVDLRKLSQHEHAAWIRNVAWPSEDVITTRSVPLKNIADDVRVFKDIINIVIAQRFMPTEKQLNADLKAVCGLYDDNDALILKYNVKEIGTIRIIDGKSLLITIIPNPSYKPSIMADKYSVHQDFIKEYVSSRAANVFNISGEDKHNPIVYESRIDIGSSCCGRLVYDTNFPPPTKWYSGIDWWCDGKNISFQIGKGLLLNPQEDYRNNSGPPLNYNKPRKFKKSGGGKSGKIQERITN